MTPVATPEPAKAETQGTQAVLDGSEAVASIAYRAHELVAIYPITPSSGMAELCDQWASEGKKNIWGQVPQVTQLQSEAGVAGAVHGALQSGALVTTFTASQGLLLMLPNMYKIAGELTPAVFHIAARAVATQALSIFGDHSDVMSARSTGWGQLFSNSVQEAMDMALIAQVASLNSRIPFLHVLDGFRTTHEVAKVEIIADEVIRRVLPSKAIRSHRDRALNPDHPVIRGTAHNPDTFFQARESVNPFYAAAPALVQEAMDAVGAETGRHYRLFDYEGAPDAERVVIAMGSGCETLAETVQELVRRGEKTGLLKVRLFRPFSAEALVAALPATTRAIAVLDRTKEPGASGEPLLNDVVTAVHDAFQAGECSLAQRPVIIGGRYGLGSKEFTPAMAAAIFQELASDTPKQRFTVGIEDDVAHTSLSPVPGFRLAPSGVTAAVFWGLGSDGTVGANKNSIKIIGEQTDLFVQGYFVYDSKKSGSVTVSHLRFGPRPIRSPYLVQRPDFIGIHQFELVHRFPILDMAAEGATVLLNSPFEAGEVWGRLPREFQDQVVAKRLRLFVLDGLAVARETGLARRINTVMQAGFFALSSVLPQELALAKIREAIAKTYGRRGEAVVARNLAAVDQAVGRLAEVHIPEEASAELRLRHPVSGDAPEFVEDVIGAILAGRGDLLPVSMLPNDGTYPSGTSRYEKRRISPEAPIWDPDLCIQCGKCVLVCPHAVIRSKVFDPESNPVPGNGVKPKTLPAKFKGAERSLYTIQVSEDDCTGCTLCVDVCPGVDKANPDRKSLAMAPLGAEQSWWDWFIGLPDEPALPADTKFNSIKNVQLLTPLFEFSGACAGCGETPYLKLMSQLFGDHAMVANATGCSSIFGGNLPTTPWSTNQKGRGPAWANSLFEDNAEFGMGMRLALDVRRNWAASVLADNRTYIGDELVDQLLAEQDRRRQEVLAAEAKAYVHLAPEDSQPALQEALELVLSRSVWIVGGDGWAYDIGYGGLDHVLAGDSNVNILVLDTEVYSNTGGQSSKATARGAVAKFASGGKPQVKKNLARLAMSYGHVYVARVCMGANDAQTLKAFLEAEAHPGPSLIIAYAPCIAHGIDMSDSLKMQKLAVETGYWPLYRFQPSAGKMTLDSREPVTPVEDFLYAQGRFESLKRSNPDAAAELLALAREDMDLEWAWIREQAARGGKVM